MTSKNYLKDVKDFQIVDDVVLGESIFLVDKDKISSTLEKKYPYLRVVGLETKFPNKIVVHAAERESLFAIKNSKGNYIILDEYGKVLNDSLPYYEFEKLSNSNLGGAPIEVTFTEDWAIKDDDMVEGEFVKSINIKNLLTNIAYSFRSSNYIPATTKGVFTNILVESSIDGYSVSIETRRGIVIKLKDVENHTTDKLLLGLATYKEMHKQGKVSGTITVFYSDKLDKEVAY